MAWFSSGRVVNPINDQVLVDAGALPPGFSGNVVLSATVATAVELQQRDAANLATTFSQVLAVPILGTGTFLFSQDGPSLLPTRLRVVCVGAPIGSVSVSIFV